MADIKIGSSTTGCNETCGCPSPCPGGNSCRCTASGEEVHMRCSCGEHCGCNPCTCSKEEVRGTGKAFCKCGPGCSCTACAS